MAVGDARAVKAMRAVNTAGSSSTKTARPNTNNRSVADGAIHNRGRGVRFFYPTCQHGAEWLQAP